MENNKITWINKIYSLDTEKKLPRKPIPDVINEWFVGSAISDNLRLSEEGRQIFDQFIPAHDFNITSGRNSCTNALYYLKLGNKIHAPFHVSFVRPDTTIRIYDEQMAIIIALHGGIKDFLGN